MSRNPYAQVALTYVRRAFSSLLSSIIAIIVLGLIGHAIYSALLISRPLGESPDDRIRVFISTLSMGVPLLAGIFAMHVKEQFAGSRSHLMPHFRRAHIVIAAAVTLILAVAAPGLEAWSMGLHSIGTVAITVVLVGATFWCVLLLANWVVLPVTIMMFINMSQTAWRSQALIASGQFEVQAVGLLVLGIAIIIFAGVRLCRLNEDMPEYHRRMPATRWAAKVSYDVPLPRILVDWFRAHAMAHLTRHVQCAARSPWSRICRWQIGLPSGWRVLLWGLFPFGLLQFLSWQHPHPMPGTVQNNLMTSMMVANSFAFVPMFLIMPQLASWLMIRTRTLGYEVMLPVGRRAYAWQLIAALAASYFQLCGVVLASTLLWWLVVVATPAPLGYIASLAAAVLLVQICQFGVLVFAYTATSLRIVHGAALIVTMIGSTMLITGGASMGEFQLLPEVLPIAAGAAALGVLLVYIAYRRWLVADFD